MSGPGYTTLNIQSMFLQREGAALSVRNMGTKSEENSDISQKLIALLAEVYKQVPDPNHIIYLSTQGMQANHDGYCVLKVEPEKLSLKEQRTFQSMIYQVTFSPLKIHLNQRPVDSSFMRSFLLKIDQITHWLRTDKIRVCLSPPKGGL